MFFPCARMGGDVVGLSHTGPLQMDGGTGKERHSEWKDQRISNELEDETTYFISVVAIAGSGDEWMFSCGLESFLWFSNGGLLSAPSTYLVVQRILAVMQP